MRGLNISKTGKPSAGEVANWTVNQVLNYVEKTALPQSIGWIQKQKQVADRFGLKLIAYEGGQHLVGIGGANNDESLNRLLHAANRHERMSDIYHRYYQAWVDEGGDLFCYFSSVGRWSKWGSWGMLEYYDSDPALSPKFTATMRWAELLGQPVNWPKSKIVPAFQ